MRQRIGGVSLVLVLGMAAASRGDEARPASILVNPVHRADAGYFTLLSVTNTSVSRSTTALFRYLNAVPGTDPLLPVDCREVYRSELLTPNDTVTVVTNLHSGAGTAGMAFITAQDPATGLVWSHNHLVGSTLTLTPSGGLFSLTAIPFEAKAAPGLPTDVNLNGRLNFDDVEYERLPASLQLDSFVPIANSYLTLIGLSGDRDALIDVQILLWNDAEFPLSAQLRFRCWFHVPLVSLSTAFTQSFLANNTPDDPTEVDLDGDGDDDVESGWARFTGVLAINQGQTVLDPPILGAVTAGPGSFEAGRTLWGSGSRRDGEF